MKERGSAGEEPIELTALLLNGNGDGANGEAERRSGYDGQRKLRLRSAKKMRGMKRDVNERKMGSKTSFGERKEGEEERLKSLETERAGVDGDGR